MPGPKRARKGSVAPLLLRLQPDLRGAVELASEAEGLSLAEWLRQAATEKLFRSAWADKRLSARVAKHLAALAAE